MIEVSVGGVTILENGNYEANLMISVNDGKKDYMYLVMPEYEPGKDIDFDELIANDEYLRQPEVMSKLQDAAKKAIESFVSFEKEMDLER